MANSAGIVMANSASRFIKCVMVGDGAVGKTCLLICYTSNKFPTMATRSIWACGIQQLHTIDAPRLLCIVSTMRTSLYSLYNGFLVEEIIISAPGQEDYNRLRPLSYIGADVFVLAFSLVNRASYENISKKWVPELRHYAPSIPVVLVGTKSDLRENSYYLANHPDAAPVTTAQGEEMRKQIGAVSYIECSSKTQQNVKSVFDAVIKVVIQPPKQKEMKGKSHRSCSIFNCSICERIHEYYCRELKWFWSSD